MRRFGTKGKPPRVVWKRRESPPLRVRTVEFGLTQGERGDSPLGQRLRGWSRLKGASGGEKRLPRVDVRWVAGGPNSSELPRSSSLTSPAPVNESRSPVACQHAGLLPSLSLVWGPTGSHRGKSCCRALPVPDYSGITWQSVAVLLITVRSWVIISAFRGIQCCH